jgi:hypothetical protein
MAEDTARRKWMNCVARRMKYAAAAARDIMDVSATESRHGAKTRRDPPIKTHHDSIHYYHYITSIFQACTRNLRLFSSSFPQSIILLFRCPSSWNPSPTCLTGRRSNLCFSVSSSAMLASISYAASCVDIIQVLSFDTWT